MSTLSRILQHKIVAIIRGAQPGDVLRIARALHHGGISVMEVTINSPKALQAIEKVADELGDSVLVGAGTVLDAETARAAICAGAQFIISPVVDLQTIRMTRRYGMVSIPGAYTATEILDAYVTGGDIIKVFPATSAAYIKNVLGPLPHIPLMPTGGVQLDNIREFKKAGAAAFGIGSALVDTSQPVTDEYLHELSDKARRFTQALTHH